jgi:dephospho-CoA kinase
MPIVIGVSGFAGAGKTSATEFLEADGFGRRFYAGQIILDEVRARQLPLGPESEKIVRLELRSTLGRTAIASLACPRIVEILKRGENVLLDAVLSLDEFRYYTESCSASLALVFIESSFDVRSSRLVRRSERPLSPDELRDRDILEKEELHLARLATEARVQINNDNSFNEFHRKLREVVKAIC